MADNTKEKIIEKLKENNSKVGFLNIFSYLGILIGAILIVEDFFSGELLTLVATVIFLSVLVLNLIQVKFLKLYGLGFFIGIFSFAAIIAFLFFYGDGNMFIWIGPFGAVTFFLLGSKKGFYVLMPFFILMSITVLLNSLYIINLPFPRSFNSFAPDFVASTILLFLFILIFQETVEKKEQSIGEYLKHLELEHSKDRSIFSTIETGLVTANAERIITFINEPGYKLLKGIPEDMVGKPIDEVLKLERDGEPINDEKNPLKQPLDEKTIKIRLSDRFNMEKTNGVTFPVGMNVTYSNENPDTRIAVVFFDLSIEKRIDELKDAFLSSMQHQISTPFSIIKWNIELLEQKDEDLEKIGLTRSSIISETRFAIDRVNQIQNNILTVSRLEQGFFPQDTEAINAKELVEETIKHLYLNIKKREVSIKTDYKKPIETITANKTIVSIIIENIISNAIKYSPLKGEVRIEVEQEADRVLFKVKDNGIGIPEKEQENIFDKFFRSENVLKKSYEGTGLGLYITKILVDHLQGDISFESEENVGTTFYVRIPTDPQIPNIKRDSYKI